MELQSVIVEKELSKKAKILIVIVHMVTKYGLWFKELHFKQLDSTLIDRVLDFLGTYSTGKSL